ncbi:hypothetical protein DFJ74DRAFT_765980 [Hyaloraphidium curvatum]|nr:hypothetical protein DFJ74DRAFT_765980 [Hyaloraphidium curvatum]
MPDGAEGSVAPPPGEFPPMDQVTGGRVPDLQKWLASRREYNSRAAGLWRIGGGLYDLTDFVDKHPGGAEWLELTRGSDITEAFEAHHPNIKFVRDKILPKYFVRDADWPRESPLTFEPDGFYSVLRNRVWERIRALGDGPKRWSNLYCDSVALLHEGLLAAMAYVGPVVVGPGNPKGLGIGWAAGLACAAGVVGGALSFMGHNYIHMRDSWRRYYVNLGGGSARNFRIHHALSHHLYPNTSLDVEYAMFERLGAYAWPHQPRMADRPVRNFLAFQAKFITGGPLLFLLQPWLYASGKMRQPLNEYFNWWNTLAQIPIRLLAIAQTDPSATETPAKLAQTACVAAGQTVLLNAAMLVFRSLWAGNVSIYSGHISDVCWRQGDFQPPLDFGLFQLEATTDRLELNRGLLLPVLATFGDHSLHHLFPSVDHAYHGYLYDELAKTCTEFGVRFEWTPYWDAIKGFYRSLWRTYGNEEPRRVGWTGKGYRGKVEVDVGTGEGSK